MSFPRLVPPVIPTSLQVTVARLRASRLIFHLNDLLNRYDLQDELLEISNAVDEEDDCILGELLRKAME